MKIALVVPGGVDRSGEYRVIPALLSLIERLARSNQLDVFALAQEADADSWILRGARVHNIGGRWPRMGAVLSIVDRHRQARFEVVHAVWAGACGLVAVTAGRLLRLPVMIHVAGGELSAIPEIAYGGMQTWKGRLREPWVLRAATYVSAASRPMIDALAALGCSALRIPLGVDLQRWPPRAPVARVPGNVARLIHVASLNRVKDQITLLRAFAALHSQGLAFHADIVGVDTLRGEIQQLTRQLGLDASVTFHGFLTQGQLRPWIERADLLVHSSLHEAGPLVTLEAAVAGVPTVGTAVGHIAEWAPQAAIAVPVGDWRGLAEGIAAVLRDDGLRMELARAAMLRATREDADFTAARFQSLYASLA